MLLCYHNRRFYFPRHVLIHSKALTPPMSSDTPHLDDRFNGFPKTHKLFVWLTAIFVTCLLIANLMGALLFSFTLPFGIKLPVVGNTALLSAGIIPFPITFLLTDLINEFYGSKGARFVTFVGFGMSVLLFLFLSIGNILPYDTQTVILPDQYMAISSNYSQMIVASLTAYLVGQLLDIQVFQWFHSITKSKLIWLRATGSTVISQLFDSLIVTFIAFSGDLPIESIMAIVFSNYTWKFLIAVGITPLLYLGHSVLRRLFQNDTPPENVLNWACSS